MKDSAYTPHMLDSIVQEILYTYYPNVMQKIVLNNSRIGDLDLDSQSFFKDLQNEIIGMYLYDIKLVFPEVISGCENNNKKLNFDTETILRLLNNKVKKITQLILKLKSLNPSNPHITGLSSAISVHFLERQNALHVGLKDWLENS